MKAGTNFFPEGDQVLVGDPFGAKYILLIIDNGLKDNQLEVSQDVKEKFYSARSTIDL